MNLIQAEAIANLYEELLNSIPRNELNLPSTNHNKLTHGDIDSIKIEDGYIVAAFSRYRGCGESDTSESYTRFNEIFN